MHYGDFGESQRHHYDQLTSKIVVFITLITTFSVLHYQLQITFVYISPPPPTRMYKGAACAFPFSRERGYFLAVCLRKISREKPEKGVFLNQSPEIWGVFQKLPEKLRKRGYDLYIHVSRAFNSPARKGDRALFTSHICGRGPEGSGKIGTHFPRDRRK